MKLQDLYSQLTSREQRALRWSIAISAVALWLATAWANPWMLLGVPLGVAAFLGYRARYRGEPDEDDLDLY